MPLADSPYDDFSKCEPEALRLRLKEAIFRIGRGLACELLQESGLVEFQNIAETTLNRWLTPRENESLPGKAQLAIRMLETASLASSAPPPKAQRPTTRRSNPPVLRFGVISNPSSIPLTFICPLVPELEPSTAERRREPSRRESGISGPDRIEAGKSRTISLRLSIKRRDKDVLDTDALIALLLSNEIDLAIIPRHTVESCDEQKKAQLLALCRVSRSPTIVLRAGEPDETTLGKGDRVFVIAEARKDNSIAQARAFCRHLEMRTGVVANRPEIIGGSSLSDRVKNIATEIWQKFTVDPHVNMTVFAPATTLIEVKRSLRDKLTSYPELAGMNAQQVDDTFRVDAASKTDDITDWNLYIRKDSLDVRTACPLLLALQKTAETTHLNNVFDYLYNNNEICIQETGLDAATLRSLSAVFAHHQAMRCDDIAPELIRPIVKSLAPDVSLVKRSGPKRKDDQR